MTAALAAAIMVAESMVGKEGGTEGEVNVLDGILKAEPEPMPDQIPQVDLYDPDMALKADLDVPVFLKSAIEVVENIINSNLTSEDYIEETLYDYDENATDTQLNPNPLFWKENV